MNMVIDLLLKIDWENFLLGERSWSFLAMVLLRTATMFLVVLVGLRMLGKRGVSQLSVFELGVVVGLGSAAGDPMFYKDVGVLSGIIVFVIVIALYHLLKYVLGKSDRLDKWVEGDPVEVIREGELMLHHLQREPLTREELFSQLRPNNISHLGQVRLAILEPTGQISVFYYADEDVKYGLPILPGTLNSPFASAPASNHYSCMYCSHTTMLEAGEERKCPVCERRQWIKSLNEKRIS